MTANLSTATVKLRLVTESGSLPLEAKWVASAGSDLLGSPSVKASATEVKFRRKKFLANFATVPLTNDWPMSKSKRINSILRIEI